MVTYARGTIFDLLGAADPPEDRASLIKLVKIESAWESRREPVRKHIVFGVLAIRRIDAQKQKGKRALVQSFPVLGEASAAAESADYPSDDLSRGRHDEFASVTSFDDLDIDLPTGSFQAFSGFRVLRAAFSRERQQNRNIPNKFAIISVLPSRSLTSAEQIMMYRKAKGMANDSKDSISFRIDAKDRHGSASVLGTTRR